MDNNTFTLPLKLVKEERERFTAVYMWEIKTYFAAQAKGWMRENALLQMRCESANIYLRGCFSGLDTYSILFCFLFVKNPWFAWRANLWPSAGKHYYLPFLPATPSCPSRTLEGLFSWTGAPQGPLTRLVRCFQNFRDGRTQLGVLQ